jgi:rhamnose transport system permease protein
MNKIKNILKMREMSLLVVILVFYLIVSVIQPSFFSLNSIINILMFVPFLLVVSLGEMVTMINRNVDVSVGSMLGFVAVVIGMIYKFNKNTNLFLIFIVAIVVGGLLGLVNGLLVDGFKLPSIIITLGTMNLYRGLVFFICGNRQIDNSYIPQSIKSLSQPQHSVVGIPYSIFIAIAIAIIVALFLRKTRKGREIFACGCNPDAAKLRGINTDKMNIFVFVLTGVLCGVAAILFISRIAYVDPNTAGLGLEFTAIAACVIGGTSLAGGVGSTLGMVLGCIFLGVINNSIAIVGISGYWANAVYGLIIIVVVIIDNALKKRSTAVAWGGRRI